MASTTADALLGIAHTGLVTTGVSSFVRVFPASGIAFVGTTDLTPNTLSVATRAKERRQVVTEFVDIVRAVLAGFAGLAPEIRPLAEG
jgi:hypothetical protein